MYDVLWLCTLFLWLSLAPQNQERFSAPALYDLVRHAVVRVDVADARGHSSSASGVLVSPDGLIATNYHVVQDGASARVTLPNGDAYDNVSIAETDQRKDIAILKIGAAGLPWLGFADSGKLHVGDAVYALGAPKGLDGTLSHGMISGLRKGSEVGPDFEGMRVIQFTAPISPGSSGGPVLDDSGRIVGLVCGFKRGGQNLNLAIPSQYVAGLVRSWRGEVRRLKTMPAVEQGDTTRSAAEIVAKARTLCISVPSGSPVLRAEIMRRFLDWGRLTLVSSPDDADLVLNVIQTGASMAQAAAWLREPESGTEIWADAKGGLFSLSGLSKSRVGRSLADDAIRFLERTLKD